MASTTTLPQHDTIHPTTQAATSHRISSIDIVRGIVMILMAIDHVRVYSGVPAGGPTYGIFFTRWITHFVAPAFIFLAGTSAFLHGSRLGNKGALARFLLTRGAWLLLLELTVIRIAWTFNFDFANYLLAGVIWVIGWCMILLAGLIYLPLPAIAAFGVGLIFMHNLMDVFAATVRPALQATGIPWLWQTLYFGGPIQLGENGPPLMVLYSIVPWIGVMAAGYAFGAIMQLEPERRRRIVLQLGIAATALFVVMRFLNVYGDPRLGNAPPNVPAIISFLNTAKYPASLLFLLMTLGPMMIAIAIAERARGPVSRVLEVFGRVPLFYYLLHIPLIHILACIVSLVRSGSVDPWLFTNHPMAPGKQPEGYMWSLPLLYLITIVAVFLLYWPCRWLANIKARSKHPWLSYL
jgi:uncharacterized membrane protein